jgi:signal transduction histidine kinase
MNHSSPPNSTLPASTLPDSTVSPASPTAGSVAVRAQPISAGHATVEIAKCDLERLQALATLGELTGTATHEFNNLLMTIMNYAKMAMRDRSDAGREKALTKILDASQRAARITGTILAQARNRKDTTTATDLAALINDTLELLGREMRKYRVKVETTIDPTTPMAMLSGNQIQRVLINLLVNARQAMAEGGTITVSLAPDAASGEVVLTVRDTGVGIPRDQLPRIFDSFYSTKSGPDDSGKGGTGLGLASTKEIIDAHGGRIRVESTVGRGTAFIIRLPVA